VELDRFKRSSCERLLKSHNLVVKRLCTFSIRPISYLRWWEWRPCYWITEDEHMWWRWEYQPYFWSKQYKAHFMIYSLHL